jgi:hypothetical protein
VNEERAVASAKSPARKLKVKADRPRKVKLKTKAECLQRGKDGKRHCIHPLMKDGKDWDVEKTMEVLLPMIASNTASLSSILKLGYEGLPLPGIDTIMRWLNASPDLQARYAGAKQLQADLMAEEMIGIAEDGSGDRVQRTDRNGNTYVELDTEHVQRSRLRIDTRKWLMSKLMPKKYGEKLELAGDPDAPLKTQSTMLDPVALAKMPEAERRKLLETLK